MYEIHAILSKVKMPCVSQFLVQKQNLQESNVN